MTPERTPTARANAMLQKASTAVLPNLSDNKDMAGTSYFIDFNDPSKIPLMNRQY
jgi:hypothetical protein